MKKGFLLAACLLVAGAAGAQTASSGGIKFGAKGGANFSNIIKTGDDDFKTDYKTGFHAGIFLEIPIVSGFAFAPEVMYSQKGYKTTGSSLLRGPYEYKLTSNFVDIPVMAKIKAGNAFNIYLGPQISFLTSTTTDFTQGSETYRSTVKETNDNLRKSLFGGVAGVGFDISSQLSLVGRYGIDFQKNNEDGTSETPEYKNQVFQVGLAVKL